MSADLWDVDELDRQVRAEDAKRAQLEADTTSRYARSARRRGLYNSSLPNGGIQVTHKPRTSTAKSTARAAVGAAADVGAPEVAIPAQAAHFVGRTASGAVKGAGSVVRGAVSLPARAVSENARALGRSVTGDSSDTATSRLVGMAFGGAVALVVIGWITGRSFNISLPPTKTVTDAPNAGTGAVGAQAPLFGAANAQQFGSAINQAAAAVATQGAINFENGISPSLAAIFGGSAHPVAVPASASSAAVAADIANVQATLAAFNAQLGKVIP